MLAERVKKWTQEWYAEGYAEGYADGYAEGYALGLEEARVRRLLVRRFGAMPDWAGALLRRGDMDQLAMWRDRARFAQSLEEVFAAGPEATG
mgnify:CR=1 FL=1